MDQNLRLDVNPWRLEEGALFTVSFAKGAFLASRLSRDDGLRPEDLCQAILSRRIGVAKVGLLLHIFLGFSAHAAPYPSSGLSNAPCRQWFVIPMIDSLTQSSGQNHTP